MKIPGLNGCFYPGDTLKSSENTPVPVKMQGRFVRGFGNYDALRTAGGIQQTGRNNI
jgi:hypothetical protein